MPAVTLERNNGSSCPPSALSGIHIPTYYPGYSRYPLPPPFRTEISGKMTLFQEQEKTRLPGLRSQVLLTKWAWPASWLCPASPWCMTVSGCAQAPAVPLNTVCLRPPPSQDPSLEKLLWPGWVPPFPTAQPSALAHLMLLACNCLLKTEFFEGRNHTLLVFISSRPSQDDIE